LNLSIARPLRRGSGRTVRLAIAAGLVAIAAAPAAVHVYNRKFSPEARAVKLRVAARFDLRAGRAGAAVDALERALALAPDRPDAYCELGAALLAMGDRPGARRALERACALDPEAVEPRFRLAVMAIEERDAARAKPLEAWLSDPARGARIRAFADTIVLLRYEIACVEGDAAAALEAADRALELRPQSLAAIAVRARIAIEAGDRDLATRLLARGHEVSAGDPRIALLRSIAREEAGDLEGARAALDEAASAAESDGEIAIRRAEIAARTGRPAEVAAALAALPEETPPGLRAYAEALEPLARGDAAAAEAALRRAIIANARLRRARLALARLLFARDDPAGARAQLRAVLEDDPLSTEARRGVALATLLGGDPQAAAADLEALLEMAGRDREAAILLVAARVRQRRPAEAERFFQALREKDPTNAAAATGEALAWLAGLDVDAAIEGNEALLSGSAEARAALEALASSYAARRSLVEELGRLEAAVADDAAAAAVRLRIADRYLGLDQLDPAERALRALLAAAPAMPEPHLGLGTIAARRKDWARAAAEAETYLAARPAALAGRALLARALLAGGEPERALAVAEGTTLSATYGDDRANATALQYIGLAAAMELGDFDRAARRFEAVRASSPGTGPAVLAAAAIAAGRTDAAAAALSPLLAAGDTERPADVDAQWLAGILALLRGDRLLAVRYGRSADPGGSIARAILFVDALIAAGDRAGAVRAADLLRPAPDRVVGPFARALKTYAATETPERVLARAARLHPLLVAWTCGFKRPACERARALEGGAEPPLVSLTLARALEDAGDPEAARATLERALERDPSSAPLLEALGRLLVREGASQEGAAALERAIAAAPGEPHLATIAGLAREELGGPGGAIATYRQAIGGDAPARRGDELMVLLLRESELIEAALARAAPALGAGRSAAVERTGLRDLVRARVADALAKLSRARDVAPGEPRVRYRLALAYRRLGAIEKAIGELENAIRLDPEGDTGIAAAKVRDEILGALAFGRRPGRTFETAASLPEGGEKRESLGLPGTRHFYRLDLSLARRVVLRYGGPEDAATEIHVARRGKGGPELVKATAVGPAEELTWRLALGPGTYTVDIVSPAAMSIAPYRLGLAPDTEPAPEGDREPNDTLALAEPLALGARVSGRLGPLEDLDMFRLPAVGGPIDLSLRSRAALPLEARLVAPGDLGETTRKRFTLAPGATAVVPSLYVGEGGLVLELSGPKDAGAPRPGSRQAPRPSSGQAYEIEAVAAQPPPGGAPFLGEPDDTPLGAHALPPPAAGAPGLVRGTIMPAGDRDILVLPPGRAALAIRAPADLPLEVEIGAPALDGTVAVVRRVAVEAKTEWRVASIGGPGLVVSIRGASPHAASPIPYEVRWWAAEAGDPEPNDTVATAVTLGAGRAVGAVDAPADRDVYRFPRGTKVGLTFRALDVPLALALLAIDPDGRFRVERRLEAAPGVPLALGDWTPSGAPGVEISAGPAGRPGRYELEVEPREAPP
jgi:Flp pilus assembly protein TadD